MVGSDLKPSPRRFFHAEAGCGSPPPPAHLHRVLADAQSVPEFDGFVPGARNDLAVVGRKSHAQDVLGVAHEAPGGGAAAGRHRGIWDMISAKEGENPSILGGKSKYFGGEKAARSGLQKGKA